MSVRDILPSPKFTTIMGSVALAVLFVYGAYVLTHPAATPSTIAVGTSNNSNDWAKALEEIQAQNPLNQAPQAPSQDVVDTLNQAATSDNVTNTIARTLLVNLSAAKAQGLGSDIPTQDALIAEAAAKINKDRGTPAYKSSDLIVVKDSEASYKTYGNAFMATAASYPEASFQKTLLAIGIGVDNKDEKQLAVLKEVGRDYTALGKALAKVPTPSTLAPFHLSVLNNIARMAETYPDMSTLLSDPLRGLAGLQLYQSLAGETARVFTSIAIALSKDGILFNKDEPGAAWSALVP